MKTMFEGYTDLVLKRLDSIEARIKGLQSNESKNERDQILTVGEVAVFLSLAKQTVYQLVSQNKIPSYKRLGRRYFSRKEIERWLMKGRSISPAEADRLIDDQISKSK